MTLFLSYARLGLHSSDPTDQEQICARLLREDNCAFLESLLHPELQADLWALRRARGNPKTRGETEREIARTITSR